MSTKKAVILTIVIVVGLWLLTPFILNKILSNSTNIGSDRGQFGDMYGFVTSLFSGITIIGLVYTIIQQREDIRIARMALTKQEEELKLTRNEFKLQNKTLKYQRFDNTFFNLLNLNLEIASEINHNTLKSLVGGCVDITRNIKKAPASSEYLNLSKEYRDNVEPFAASMGQFVKWICQQKGKSKKEKYFPLVFSQLNSAEKQYLFYYFLLEKIHPNINDFREYLLESVPITPDIELALELYKTQN